uniref:Uncharacterized protein n=1 Tax=Glossina pallidipes TaxID=7398 RepID=A0A1B0AC72_GLOPL
MVYEVNEYSQHEHYSKTQTVKLLEKVAGQPAATITAAELLELQDDELTETDLEEMLNLQPIEEEASTSTGNVTFCLKSLSEATFMFPAVPFPATAIAGGISVVRGPVPIDERPLNYCDVIVMIVILLQRSDDINITIGWHPLYGRRYLGTDLCWYLPLLLLCCFCLKLLLKLQCDNGWVDLFGSLVRGGHAVFARLENTIVCEAGSFRGFLVLVSQLAAVNGSYTSSAADPAVQELWGRPIILVVPALGTSLARRRRIYSPLLRT